MKYLIPDSSAQLFDTLLNLSRIAERREIIISSMVDLIARVFTTERIVFLRTNKANGMRLSVPVMERVWPIR
jgi:hypothetical protein